MSTCLVISFMLFWQPSKVLSRILHRDDVAKINQAIVESLNLTAQYGLICNDKVLRCPQSSLFGGLLRLAFHDAAGGGGPNGCIDFTEPLNNGLQSTVNALEPVYLNFSSIISRADLWVLAANMAVLYASTVPAGNSSDRFVSPPLDPTDPLHLPFRYGRDDVSICNDTNSLPTTKFDMKAINDLFGGKFGMSPSEVVAIMGGHSLGRTHFDVSGFDGGWTPAQSSFSNRYYQVFGASPWINSNGSSVWVEFTVVNEIMLLKPDVELLYQTFPSTDKGHNPPWCNQFFRFLPNGNCPYQNNIRNIAIYYANNIGSFYGNFSSAYQKMTEYSYSNLLADVGAQVSKDYPRLDGFSQGTAVPTVKSTGASTDFVSKAPYVVLPPSQPMASISPSNSSSISTSNAPLAEPSTSSPKGSSSALLVAPTAWPSTPSTWPSALQSARPTSAQSIAPSAGPTSAPSAGPTGAPSAWPSSAPSVEPSAWPSTFPSTGPSMGQSCSHSLGPSIARSVWPSSAPSIESSTGPSISSSKILSVTPSFSPSTRPSISPSAGPSYSPSFGPYSTQSSAPCSMPSKSPSAGPSTAPSIAPSVGPTSTPSVAPSAGPSTSPFAWSSLSPSTGPSNAPSSAPSMGPSTAPTGMPSTPPSTSPWTSPSTWPSSASSAGPSTLPSSRPSKRTFARPSLSSSAGPLTSTAGPTSSTTPSTRPSNALSTSPLAGPSVEPSKRRSTTQPLPPSTASRISSLAPSILPSRTSKSASSVRPSIYISTIPSHSNAFGPSIIITCRPINIPSIFSPAPTSSQSKLPSSLSSMPRTMPSSDHPFSPSLNPLVIPFQPSVNFPSVFGTQAPSIKSSQKPSVNPSIAQSFEPEKSTSTSPTPKNTLPTLAPPTVFLSTAPWTIHPTILLMAPSQAPDRQRTSIPISNPIISHLKPTFTPTLMSTQTTYIPSYSAIPSASNPPTKSTMGSNETNKNNNKTLNVNQSSPGYYVLVALITFFSVTVVVIVLLLVLLCAFGDKFEFFGNHKAMAAPRDVTSDHDDSWGITMSAASGSIPKSSVVNLADDNESFLKVGNRMRRVESI